MLFVLVVLSLPERKTYHETMATVMFLQCVGLLRMRAYPIDLLVYPALVGFSYLELLFVPNALFALFPAGYSEHSLDAVKFAWGTHNFVQHMGSIFLVAVPLQVLLFIYYVAKRSQPDHLSRYKMLQEFLVEFFMPIVFFNGVSNFIGLSLNQILSSP